MDETRSPRMTVRGMLDECIDVLLLEKGFLYTTKEVLLRPGQTIRRVLNGDRTNLNPPLRFMFISVTMIAIAMNLTADWIYVDFQQLPTTADVTDKISSVSETLQQYQSKQEDIELRFRAAKALEGIQKSRIEHVMEAFYSWNNVVLTLAVPIYAIGTFVFFRRNYNFAEHLAINAYIHGAQCIMAFLSIPLSLMGWVTASSILYMLGSMAYQLWAWAHVFQIRSFRAWVFAPVLILISLLVYILVSAILMTIVFAWVFWSVIPASLIV